MREYTAELGGHGFHIREWGAADAPPILALHGFPEYGGAWAELAAHLPAYRLIAPDQRGFGQSWAPQDTDHYKTAKLVGDMSALIGQIGAPVTVLGHDWGAAVAYGLAMFQPALVDRLIVMNGVHPAPFQRALAAGGAQTAASQYIPWLRAEGSENILAADDFAKLRALFAAHMDMSWLAGGRLEDYLAEWARPGRMRGMVNWYRASPLVVPEPGHPAADLPHDKLRVPMPHLLIWGENDTALLPEATEGLEAYCADLTRATVPDADHWLHHQQPAAVAQIIRDWLAR
ncbi:alpha/beta hydrolase [Lutimaribacter sp. EGI FJ00015]|uniref:Alpha/beta hydrolase n=1 Tax=Lutimaribacter degradans TaxID=2945989 RepID=A0ACC6A1G9_9RHOB|nr:alpha/beta hydrolase [Lutimaribacter sp. EGI FJ00013]MCM2563841.1 alpha/beta hydrolase [Lutimaribacter sp. EGI FJ00013]MCO0615004.1 alpha/beta hydrolase [Lutimaribacter sp. EGI FJ00015]MCO0637668.1 alpha/beta hydrolase [Lutimaribacter sp. EGI FJ00014]